MEPENRIDTLSQYAAGLAPEGLQMDEAAIEAAYDNKDDDQSLAIKVLTVLGGILASMAFLGFLFIAGLYDASGALLILGTACVAGAIWVNKASDRIIMDTLSVSAFIIGLILLAVGFEQFDWSVELVCLVFIVIAGLSLFITQNFILSFISILLIHGSILTLIITNDAYDLVHGYAAVLALMLAYVGLNEASYIKSGEALAKLYNPGRIALIFAFLSVLGMLGIRDLAPVSIVYSWIPSIIIIAAIIYVLLELLNVLGIERKQDRIIICIVTALLLLPTGLSPAISGSILIMLLSFFVNHKTGFAIGVVAFIYFVGQYYYDLDFTLLTKSILLFSSGVLFLALYLFTHKKLMPDEEV